MAIGRSGRGEAQDDDGKVKSGNIDIWQNPEN